MGGASIPWRLAAAGLIALAAATVYCNSFHGPFIYDDLTSIPANRTIWRLRAIGQVLSPPRHAETVTGRPLLNLSFALNYRLGNVNVWGYHAVNLAIHISAALLLFGVLRRTLLLPVLRNRWGKASTGLALSAALLWAVHPLQTESVTYIVERAESLAALFYLLTLYCVIRGAESIAGKRPFQPPRSTAATVPPMLAQEPVPSPVPGLEQEAKGPRGESAKLFGVPLGWAWYAAAVLGCLAGMATKEILVTAPVLVLLYDRTFLGGSFRQAMRRRWPLYAGLAATWGLLVCLLVSTGLPVRRAEFHAPSIWLYAVSQPRVILHYLRLCLWPGPLCLDYGWPVAKTVREVLPGLLVIGGLVALAFWGTARRKGWGFLGVWFFLVLAPTSSVVPLADLAAEHRLYLPLAAVTTLAVLGGYALCRTMARYELVEWRAARIVAGGLVGVACIVLGGLTLARNTDYRSALSIWQDAVAKAPDNSRALNNLGTILRDEGKPAEAIDYYERALTIAPDDAMIYNNLGAALVACGKLDKAIRRFHEAVALKPDYLTAYLYLGNALAHAGRFEEAVAEYRQALKVKPDSAQAYYELGVLLATRRQIDEAIVLYRKAVKIRPDFAEAHNNLANTLADRGQVGEAIEHYRQAVAIKPGYAEAHRNFGVFLERQGRLDLAMAQWQAAIRLRPNDIDLLTHAAWVLATCPDESIRNGANAVAIAVHAARTTKWREPTVLAALAAACAEIGRFPDAVKVATRALELASAQGNAALANTVQAQLKLYKAGKPFHTAQ